MPQLKNDRFLRACFKLPVDHTPIWIMRQAGRYLPEYRKTRSQAGSFMALCKTPELACEVTLQPLMRYPLDAAIIFSDILTIPDAMGLGLHFVENEGPRFERPVRKEADIEKLVVPDAAALQYVYDAISLTARELAGKVPLIGFCGSPWTLAAYMIEGQGKSQFPLAQQMLISAPDLLHKLLNILAESITQHLNLQLAAGAQAVMLFDTWGGLLNNQDYQTFSLAYIQQIIAGIKRTHYNKDIAGIGQPVILFTKNGSRFLPALANAGCEVIGVDWEMSLKDVRLLVGDKVALQGNMDPAYLRSSPDKIRAEVAAILNAYGKGPGHVFNLGHGITPEVPPEHVAVLVEAVHELSKPYHAGTG